MHSRFGMATALLLMTSMLALAQESQAEPPKSATGSDVRDVDAIGTDKATKAVAAITNEQKVRAGDAFGKQSVAPAKNVSANIGVGDVVPDGVTLHTVPEPVIKVAPAYRDFKYFMLDDKQIVIVDAATKQVADILVVPE